MTKVQTDGAVSGVEEIRDSVRRIQEAMASDPHRRDGDYDFGTSVLSLVSRVAIDLHRLSQAAVRATELLAEQNEIMRETFTIFSHDGSIDDSGAVEPERGN